MTGNDLTHNFSGNIWPQSSELTEPLLTDPGLSSGISVQELICTSKKKKKVHVGNKWSNILPKILASKVKATTIMQKNWFAIFKVKATVRTQMKARLSDGLKVIFDISCDFIYC